MSKKNHNKDQKSGEESEQNEQDITEYARKIGIDPNTEPQLMWVARDAFLAPLPRNWNRCHNENGEMSYFNSVTNESTSVHPCELLDRMEVIERRKRLKLKMKKTLSPCPQLPEDEDSDTASEVSEASDLEVDVASELDELMPEQFNQRPARIQTPHLEVETCDRPLVYEASDAQDGAPPNEETEPYIKNLVQLGNNSPEPQCQQDSEDTGSERSYTPDFLDPEDGDIDDTTSDRSDSSESEVAKEADSDDPASERSNLSECEDAEKADSDDPASERSNLSECEDASKADSEEIRKSEPSHQGSDQLKTPHLDLRATKSYLQSPDNNSPAHEASRCQVRTEAADIFLDGPTPETSRGWQTSTPNSCYEDTEAPIQHLSCIVEEEENHSVEEDRKMEDEEREELMKQKEKQMSLLREDLKREEEEEERESLLEKKKQMRKQLIQEEEEERKILMEKKKQMYLLQEELKTEAEEETGQLVKEKEKQIRLLWEDVKREEQEERAILMKRMCEQLIREEEEREMLMMQKKKDLLREEEEREMLMMQKKKELLRTLEKERQENVGSAKKEDVSQMAAEGLRPFDTREFELSSSVKDKTGHFTSTPEATVSKHTSMQSSSLHSPLSLMRKRQSTTASCRTFSQPLFQSHSIPTTSTSTSSYPALDYLRSLVPPPRKKLGSVRKTSARSCNAERVSRTRFSS